MVRKVAILAALTCATAFGQSKVPGAGTPSGAPTARNSGQPDAGSVSDLHAKSIDQVLQDDPKLSSKLKSMLPPDLTPQQACSGFKTVEQCVTTIHIAQNLKLPLADLKSKTTGKGATNLQKAIEQMATGVDPKEEMKKAKRQTSEDMKGVNLFGS